MRIFTYKTCSTLSICLLLCFLSATATAALSEKMKTCLMEAMEQAEDTTVLLKMQEQCEQIVAVQAEDKTKSDGPSGIVSRRAGIEQGNVLKPFTLMAHRPNYLLFGAYASSGYGTEDFVSTFGDEAENFEDVEARFQLSVKFPLLIDIMEKKVDLYAAYTNRSFWQLYASDISAPFRDTNHEPEAWVQFRPSWEFLGMTNTVNQFGFNHQSNGRGGDLSRSWNRVFGNFIFENESLALSIKPWIRIEEDEDDDDNPDIEDFLGYGEIRAAYKWREHTFGIMLRNILESEFEKGTIELSWSFPLWDYKYLRGYIQYFNGYGESLVDYDRHANTIGFGVSLTDFL